MYGAGIQPLISGYPGRETTTQLPSPTALQTGLGTIGTLASIYGKLNPPQTNPINIYPNKF
jgi:hypothetical protein